MPYDQFIKSIKLYTNLYRQTLYVDALGFLLKTETNYTLYAENYSIPIPQEFVGQEKEISQLLIKHNLASTSENFTGALPDGQKPIHLTHQTIIKRLPNFINDLVHSYITKHPQDRKKFLNFLKDNPIIEATPDYNQALDILVKGIQEKYHLNRLKTAQVKEYAERKFTKFTRERHTTDLIKQKYTAYQNHHETKLNIGCEQPCLTRDEAIVRYEKLLDHYGKRVDARLNRNFKVVVTETEKKGIVTLYNGLPPSHKVIKHKVVTYEPITQEASPLYNKLPSSFKIVPQDTEHNAFIASTNRWFNHTSLLVQTKSAKFNRVVTNTFKGSTQAFISRGGVDMTGTYLITMAVSPFTRNPGTLKNVEDFSLFITAPLEHFVHSTKGTQLGVLGTTSFVARNPQFIKAALYEYAAAAKQVTTTSGQFISRAFQVAAQSGRVVLVTAGTAKTAAIVCVAIPAVIATDMIVNAPEKYASNISDFLHLYKNGAMSFDQVLSATHPDVYRFNQRLEKEDARLKKMMLILHPCEIPKLIPNTELSFNNGFGDVVLIAFTEKGIDVHSLKSPTSLLQSSPIKGFHLKERPKTSPLFGHHNN